MSRRRSASPRTTAQGTAHTLTAARRTQRLDTALAGPSDLPPAAVRLALDKLALKPGQTLGVTGAAGAVGGYAVELGVSDGLRVIAVAAPEDEALGKRFGASIVVPRGDRT